LFALNGFPHRDDAASLAARRPDHHHHSTDQQADGDKAELSVFLPRVLGGEVVTSKDGSSVGKVNPTLDQGLVTLGRGRRLFAWIYCMHIKSSLQGIAS
jgi:hypothetical protein